MRDKICCWIMDVFLCLLVGGCMFLYIFTYIYVHVCMCLYAFACIHVRVCMCVCIHMHLCMCMYVFVYVYAYMCLCTYLRHCNYWCFFLFSSLIIKLTSIVQQKAMDTDNTIHQHADMYPRTYITHNIQPHILSV